MGFLLDIKPTEKEIIDWMMSQPVKLRYDLEERSRSKRRELGHEVVSPEAAALILAREMDYDLNECESFILQQREKEEV